MARILRGDVVWANLNPTVGHEQVGLRPVLVLSREEFNARSGIVIALPITSSPGKVAFPFTLEIRSARLPKQSWAKISQIRTLSTEPLGRRICRLKLEELKKMIDGLNEIIGRPDR